MLRPSRPPVAYSKRQASGDGRLRAALSLPGKRTRTALGALEPEGTGVARRRACVEAHWGQRSTKPLAPKQDDLQRVTLPQKARRAGSDAPSSPPGFETARSPGGCVRIPPTGASALRATHRDCRPLAVPFCPSRHGRPVNTCRPGYLRDGRHVLARSSNSARAASSSAGESPHRRPRFAEPQKQSGRSERSLLPIVHEGETRGHDVAAVTWSH
jgi:hypothetical protein